MASDIISDINTNYGEGLTNTDVKITRYNSATGQLVTCYFHSGVGIWVNDFTLDDGEAYIIEIAPAALSGQPRSYQAPLTEEVKTPVSIDIYNGKNYRGIAGTSLTDASDLALDIKSYMSTNYGETLANEDIKITRYNSATGQFVSC